MATNEQVAEAVPTSLGVRTSRSLPTKRAEGTVEEELRAASAQTPGSKSQRDPDDEGDPRSPSNELKEALIFRMCEVHAAPRLPHVTAENWPRIADSFEHMKFGVCKFGQIAGVEAKDRKRWEQIKSGQLKPHTAPAMPRRPRVPPAPRRRILATRPAPKSIEPHEAEQKRRPSTVATGSEVRKRWEPQPCPWCGELEPPTHPKQCKLRLVECKHCKQKMELGSLRLHFKGCAARPMVQPPRSTKAGSGFLTLHRLQSTAQQLSRQLQDVLARFVGQLPEPEQVTTFMNDLDAKLEVFGEEICTLRTRYECRSLSDTEDSQVLKQCLKEAQKHLYFLRARVLMAEKTSMAVEASLKAGERSRMRCGVSRLQSSCQQIHRHLDELTQEAVKMEIGDPRMNKRYGPAQLEEQLESMKDEVNALERLQETRVAQGLAPDVQGLTELQGRLNFFMELLICVTEVVSKNDQSTSLSSIARHRSSKYREEKRPVFPGLSEAQVELAESSPLPPDRGPAGMGRREVPLSQLREEIAEERKRFIAYHLLRLHTNSPRTW